MDLSRNEIICNLKGKIREHFTSYKMCDKTEHIREIKSMYYTFLQQSEKIKTYLPEFADAVLKKNEEILSYYYKQLETTDDIQIHYLVELVKSVDDIYR